MTSSANSAVVLVVHGGAGRLARHELAGRSRRRYEEGLARALRAGQAVLLRGGSATRAVVAAVREMEDDELFNAGLGSALCADGTVELSASLMNGRNKRVGAMVGLRRIRNPILAANSLLRHVHGLLFGEQAEEFAEAAGLETVSPEYFRTPKRVRQWEKYRHTERIVLDHTAEGGPHGTVGAVALDRRGNLAAATSTGGLVNQLPGRVGDSPVIGAGTWADRACAISATGKGDAFARIAFARRVADLVDLAKKSPEEAAQQALDEVSQVAGRGGCIVVARDGRWATPFNTHQMLRGWTVDRGAPVVAIEAGDEREVG